MPSPPSRSRALLAIVCLRFASSRTQLGGWHLNKLSLAAYPDARCLDGSPGAYYVFPGDASTFLLHIQGGGWCSSLADCANRAKFPVYPGEPSIGSTAAWEDPEGGPCTHSLEPGVPPCASDGGSGGIFSSNATINPLFHNATRVWLGYCSGDGFSGTRQGPQPVNATHAVYFGGSFILDAILRELLNKHGMSNARTVILKGCSAGGASTFAHADSVGALVRATIPGVRYAALPGAGFLLDLAPFNNQTNDFRAMTQWVYETVGANASCNSKCIATFERRMPGSGWLCFFAEHVLPFIDTPLFVANSVADAAQLAVIMKLGCAPAIGNCNASQLAYLDSFRDAMVERLQPVLSSDKHGAFLLDCVVHMVENVDGAWDAIPVGGRTMNTVFSNWWAGQPNAKAVDSAWTNGTGKYGGNALCPMYGPVPSWPTYN